MGGIAIALVATGVDIVQKVQHLKCYLLSTFHSLLIRFGWGICFSFSPLCDLFVVNNEAISFPQLILLLIRCSVVKHNGFCTPYVKKSMMWTKKCNVVNIYCTSNVFFCNNLILGGTLSGLDLHDHVQRLSGIRASICEFVCLHLLCEGPKTYCDLNSGYASSFKQSYPYLLFAQCSHSTFNVFDHDS